MGLVNKAAVISLLYWRLLIMDTLIESIPKEYLKYGNYGVATYKRYLETSSGYNDYTWKFNGDFFIGEPINH